MNHRTFNGSYHSKLLLHWRLSIIYSNEIPKIPFWSSQPEDYPLVNIQKTIEHGHWVLVDFPMTNCDFSIVFWYVYQRVSPINHHISPIFPINHHIFHSFFCMFTWRLSPESASAVIQEHFRSVTFGLLSVIICGACSFHDLGLAAWRQLRRLHLGNVGNEACKKT